MAVVLMEGFDHHEPSIKGWTGVSGAQNTGRLGGKAWEGGGSFTLTKPFPGAASYDTLICGFGHRNNYGGDAQWFAFRNGTTLVASLWKLGTGLWQLRNAAGAAVATGATIYPSMVWWYFEVKVFRSATVGTLELRINGSPTAECSATGLNLGALSIDNVAWSGYNGLQEWTDDVYVLDPTTGSAPTNDWLGDVRVETLAPNGNGASTAWTGGYTDIDDQYSVDSDTTYVSSSTPGDRETATLGDLAVVSGAVYAVQVNVVARKDDAGLRTIAPVLRTGGVNYDGTTTPALATGYWDYTQLYERLDPSGAAWSIATVNALEAGVKLVA